MANKLITVAILIIGLMLTGPADADIRLVFKGSGVPGTNQPESGSWFSLKVLDLDFDGAMESSIYTPVSSDEGIIVGTAQAEGIDQKWNFLANPGNHISANPVVVSDSQGNTQTLDFSGWALMWKDTDLMLVPDKVAEMQDGAAMMVCEHSCEVGETFTLHYSARISDDSPWLADAEYRLHLTGTIEEAY